MNRLSTRLLWLAIAFGFALSAYAQAQGSKAGAPATARAIFAGGCFWCMEPPYDKLPGVISTTSGYTGGRTKNPTYEQVSTGTTGHAEAVQVEYDPAKVTYAQLLDVLWHNVDPTQRDGQFCDHGSQYRTAIFYLTPEQQKLAASSKTAIEKMKPFKGDIVTEVTPAGDFYPAEEYHQDFYRKNPAKYKFYRTGCGRDARLEVLWRRSAQH